MEPRGNTGAVMEWVASKGVARGKSGLTQAERHVNAAMIQCRINRLLSRFERAAVECAYGEMRNLYDVALMLQINDVDKGLHLPADLAAHIYSKGHLPCKDVVLQRYHISPRTFYRRLKAVKSWIARYEQQAFLKLERDFADAGIVGVEFFIYG